MNSNPVENSAKKICRLNMTRNRINRFHLTRVGRLFALAALVALGLLSAATGAKAGGCTNRYRADAAPIMPFMNQQQENQSSQQATIVGLWHVLYTANDDSPFGESFKMWHSDGIEFENAFLPPAGGNICYGVWVPIGPRSVKLHHIGLMFDSGGTLTNTFTIDEYNTVAFNGLTYKGTFDFKVYDLSGNLLQEVKGTQAATRITVP